MQAVCDTLEQIVSEGTLKQYAIDGATAAGFHGEPLATRDVDVFVFLDAIPDSLLVSLESVFTRLSELGFNEFEEEGLLIHGFPVRFQSASPGLESEAVDSAMVVEWDQHRMRVMRPKHLAAIALTVGRPKDRARVVYLAELPNFDFATFNDILTRHGLSAQWHQWASALGLKH
ncbi:MAG: hypothetical protein JHC76_12665 [Akkermansiaceae bacterium]|nr:hypothetical protein [Akkermansiaceae bacterium]